MAAVLRRTLAGEGDEGELLLADQGGTRGLLVYPCELPYNEGVEKSRAEKQPLDRKQIDAICAKIASLPVLDSRTPDEVLGYDDIDLPR